MANVIVEELIFKADEADNLGAAKKVLKEIKNALLNVEEGSEAFIKLSEAAAKVKDRVEDANAAIDRANPDKFNGLAAAAKIAATGIQLTTGAMALFGDESEDVQKALMKVQAAMAFAEGLQNVKDLKKEFVALGNVVKANPMLAIATALIAIGAAAYSLYDNYQKLYTVSGRLNELNKEINKTSVEAAKNSAVERNNLDNLYKSATDLNLSLKERQTAVEKLQETYPITFKNFTAEEIALGKAKQAYDGLSESILAASMVKAKQGLLDQKAMEFATEEQELIQKIQAATKKANEGDPLFTGKYVQALKETLEEKRKIFQEDNANLLDALKVDQENSKIANDNITAVKENERKKDVSGAKDAAAEKLRIAEAEEKEKAAIRERYRQLTIDKDFLAFEAFKKDQDDFLKIGLVTQDQYNANLQAKKEELFGKFEAIERKGAETTLVVQDYVYAKQAEKLTAFQNFKQKLESENGKAAMMATASLFASLGELTKKNAKLQKGFAIGEATINTYRAVSSAMAQPTPLPINLLMAGIALLNGLKQVQNIMSVKEDGGGGGGGAGAPQGLSSINVAPSGVQPSTQLDENGNRIAPQQPYNIVVTAQVIETEMTAAQRRVDVIQQMIRNQ